MSESHSRLDALLASGKITPEQHARMAAALQATKPGIPGETSAPPPPASSSTEKVLLGGVLGLLGLILFLFTPYTHQLDEIKTSILLASAPILLLLLAREFDPARISTRDLAPFGLLAAFFGAGTLSFLLGDVNAPLGERSLAFQLSAMTFGIAIGVLVNTPQRLRTAFHGLTVLGGGAAVVALLMYAGVGYLLKPLLQAIGGENVLPWVTLLTVLSPEGAREMYSTILNPEFFAVFLLMLLWFPLACYLTADGWRGRVLSLGSYILMLVCLSMTQSSESIAVVGLISAPLFLLIAARAVRQADGGREAARRLRPVGIVTAVFCVLVLLPTLYFFPMPEYKSALPIIWKGAVLVWLFGPNAAGSAPDWSSLLFGTGPGGFRAYFPVHRPADYFQHQINNVTSNAHSLYLDLLAEYGLVGLTLFLVLSAFLLRRAYGRLRSVPDAALRVQIAAWITGFVGALVVLSVSRADRWAVDAAFFWALVGIGISIVRMGASSKSGVGDGIPLRLEFPRARLLLHSAVLLVAVGFLVRGLPQGVQYFQAAVENGKGLRYLDAADVVAADAGKDYLRRSQKHFTRAVDLNPTFTTSWYKLGHVAYQLGDLDGAVTAYRALQKVDPHYSEVHQNLSLVLTEKAKQAELQEKIRLLREAVDEARLAAGMSAKVSTQWSTATVVLELATAEREAGAIEESRRLESEARTYYWRILAHRPKLSEELKEWKQYSERARKALGKEAEGAGKV